MYYFVIIKLQHRVINHTSILEVNFHSVTTEDGL
jgi:hypothetical protein